MPSTKCPYCRAAISKRKASERPVACPSCSRILEECHTDVQGLFVELLHDVPFCVVTPDLSEKRETQIVVQEDASSRNNNGFMTAFSTASLELSPLFTTTSSSISGHLAELERLLGDSLYSAGEGSSSPSTTDILRAYFQILEVASILGLDRDRADHAVLLFRKCIAANSLRNRNVEALATACLVHAMREAQEPRTLQKVAAAAGLPQKEVGRHLKVLAAVLKLSQPINSNSIAVHLPRFCSALQLDKTTQDLAAHVGEVVITKSFCTRRNPISISAAAIYLSCQLEDKRKTQTEICKATGLTEVTLRKVYKELLENLDDLLPPNYMPPVPLERAFPVTAAALGRVTASRNASANAPLCPPEPHTAASLRAGAPTPAPPQESAQRPQSQRIWPSPSSSIPPANHPHALVPHCREPEPAAAGVRATTPLGVNAPLPTFKAGEGSAFTLRGQSAARSGWPPLPAVCVGGPAHLKSGEADGVARQKGVKGAELEREERLGGDAHEADEDRHTARERDRAVKEQEGARDWSEHVDRCREGGAGASGQPPPSFENAFFGYQGGMGTPRMLLGHNQVAYWAAHAANQQRMFHAMAAEAKRQEMEASQAGHGHRSGGGGAAGSLDQGTQDSGPGMNRIPPTAEVPGIQPSVGSISKGLAPGHGGEGMGQCPWIPPSGLEGKSGERGKAGVRDRAEAAGKEGVQQSQVSERPGQVGNSEGLNVERSVETQGGRQLQERADSQARFCGGQGACAAGGEAGGMPPSFAPGFQGFPPSFWHMLSGGNARFPMFPPMFHPSAFARSLDSGGGGARREGSLGREAEDEKGESSGKPDGVAASGPRHVEPEGSGRVSAGWSSLDVQSQGLHSPMMMPPAMPFPPLFLRPPPRSREGAGSGDKGRPENGSLHESNRACGAGVGDGGFRPMDYSPMLDPMLGMRLSMAMQQMYGVHAGGMGRPSPLMEVPRVAEVGGEPSGAVEHNAPP